MQKAEIILPRDETNEEIDRFKKIKGTPYVELSRRMDSLVDDAREVKRRCDKLIKQLPFIADLDHDSVAVQLHENDSTQGRFCALVVSKSEPKDQKKLHIVKFVPGVNNKKPSTFFPNRPAQIYVGRYKVISKFGDTSDSPIGGDPFDPVDIKNFNDVLYHKHLGREHTSSRWDLVEDPIEICRITGLAMYGAVYQMMHPRPIGYLKLEPMDYPKEMIPLLAALPANSPYLL